MNYCVLLDCLSNRAKPIQQVKKTGILQTAYDLISCETVQLVPLYPDRLPKGYEAVCDENRFGKLQIFNPLASWLYGCDDHGVPIINNVVIFKVKKDDFAWMTEEEAKAMAEELNKDYDRKYDIVCRKAFFALLKD